MISQVRSRTPRRPQLVEQLPELLVEVGDAIVIGIGGERHVLGASAGLVQVATNAGSSDTLAFIVGSTPNRWTPPRRQLVGSMGVGVVQEREERPRRLRADATASRGTRD